MTEMADKEYIEREAAKTAIMDYIGEQTMGKYTDMELGRASRMGAEGAMHELDYVPAADVVEVRHGEWVHTDLAVRWDGKDECSECHFHDWSRIDLSHFNYCPSCGAKMDGKGDA